MSGRDRVLIAIEEEEAEAEELEQELQQRVAALPQWYDDLLGDLATQVDALKSQIAEVRAKMPA